MAAGNALVVQRAGHYTHDSLTGALSCKHTVSCILSSMPLFTPRCIKNHVIFLPVPCHVPITTSSPWLPVQKRASPRASAPRSCAAYYPCTHVVVRGLGCQATHYIIIRLAHAGPVCRRAARRMVRLHACY